MKTNSGKTIKKNRRTKRLHLILAVVFYFCGLLLMKSIDIEDLKQSGIAQQDEYAYTDSEGEEHEGKTLIEINGIGKILTYRDVYLYTIMVLILTIFFCEVLFKRSDLIELIIWTYCVMGILLIRLTTNVNIIPTILFWLSIAAVYTANCTAIEETS